MPVQPPSAETLERLAAANHIELTADELETFAAGAGAMLAGYARLDELPDERLPVRYPRADLVHRLTHLGRNRATDMFLELQRIFFTGAAPKFHPFAMAPPAA